MDLSKYIRDIPDFPSKGVTYKDITPLLQNATAFKTAVNRMVEHFCEEQVDLVLGIEARGFLLAAAIAYAMNAGLVIARKPGKLPYEVNSEHYITEYSTDSLHIHKDSICKNNKVLIIDDVLATGGTARAAAQLVQKSGGNIVGFGFLLELGFLQGRDILTSAPVYSLLQYL